MDFKSYIKVHVDWRALESSGETEAGQDLLAAALDEIVEPDGSLKGWAFGKRKDIVFDSLNLRGRMERSGRLALALHEQDRSERMINAWAREVGAPGSFNCLIDAPIPQMDDLLSTLVWRMRSARSSVLDAQGDSIAALELLELTVKESQTIPLKGSKMGDELRRSYNSLGNQLAFLGYWDRAVEMFDATIADKRWNYQERVQRAIAMARLNRLFPLAKMMGYSDEIVSEAKAIPNLPGAVQTPRDRANYDRQIAKIEYRAGMADEARQRVKVLLEEKGSLTRMDRLDLERIYFVEDTVHSDENATDADYDSMLETYRERGILRSLPTVYRSYAGFLYRGERIREAIPMLQRAIELSEGQGWTLHLPPLLAFLAQMQDEIGEHAAAAETWKRIDAINVELSTDERGYPEVRRIRSGLARLDWLERNTQTKQARAWLVDLRKSAKRDQLGKTRLETLDNLEVADSSPAEAVKEPIKSVAKEQPPVVIEPVATQSVIEQGGVPARTRFSLLNPGEVPIKGVLRASGSALVMSLLEDGSGVRIELGKGETSASLPISLVANQRLLIEASAPAQKSNCKIEWLNGGEVRSEANWIVSASKRAGWKEVDVQGTTASVARSSQFYAVPLFQEIRWIRKMKHKAKNFRVRTSAESWVRYQLPDGRTIAIDGNGDGDFKDAGDSIASGFDTDGNLFPDAISGSKLGVFALEILVFPEKDAKGSTSVDFELLENDGTWKITASNQLNAPSDYKTESE